MSLDGLRLKALMNRNNRKDGENDIYLLDSKNNLLENNGSPRRAIHHDGIGGFIVKIKSEKERNHPLTLSGNFLNHGVFKVVAKLSQLIKYKDDLEFIGDYEPRFKSIIDFEEIEKISFNHLGNNSKRSYSSQDYMKISVSVTYSLDSITEEQQREEMQKIVNELNNNFEKQLSKGKDYFPIHGTSHHMEMELLPLVSSKITQILKSHPNVHYIEKVLKLGFFNKGGVQLALSVSPNGAPMTNPFYDLGIYGKGQIVGLSDTGIDHDHCFFRDSSNPVPDDNTINMNHRKIVSYLWFKFEVNGQKITTDFKDDVSGHGTHVAGTIVGSMEDTSFTHPINQYHGIAPMSKLFFVDMKDSSNEIMFMSHELDKLFEKGYNMSGVKIFSNSYGTSPSLYLTCSFDCVRCRVINSFDTFRAGDSISNAQCKTIFGSETCCSITNQYTSSSQNLDRFLWNNQDAVVLFAAGNDGTIASQETLSEQANSKNVIAVGASRTSNSALISSLDYEDYYTRIKEAELGFSHPEQCCLHSSDAIKEFCCPSYIEKLFKNSEAFNEKNIASFSSKGPAHGGRIKPDLVSVGQNIVSAHSDGSLSTNQCGPGRPKEGNDAALLSKRGTSMSTPLVAGACALIREYLQTHRGVANPSGHLIKALVIHSAILSKGTVSMNGVETKRVELTSFYQPNHVEGHGIMSLGSLLKTEDGKDVGLTFFQNNFYESQQTFKLCYKVVGGGSWFKSTLAWYDYPSDGASFVPLINNLDLIVNTHTVSGSDSTKVSNWVVYGGNDVGKIDTLNNVEKVTVDSLGYSENTNNYVSVAVYMNQLASKTANQPYSLVLSYLNGTLLQVDNSLCTYSKDVPPRKFRVDIVAAIAGSISAFIVIVIIVIVMIIVILILRFWKKNESKRKKSVIAASMSSSVMPEMTEFTPTY